MNLNEIFKQLDERFETVDKGNIKIELKLNLDANYNLIDDGNEMFSVEMKFDGKEIQKSITAQIMDQFEKKLKKYDFSNAKHGGGVSISFSEAINKIKMK